MLPALERVWSGYWELQGDRSYLVGFGSAHPGSLPYVAKAKWLDDHGIFGERRRFFEGLWGELDRAYLEHAAERAAEASSSG